MQAGLSLCWSLIPHCWKSHVVALMVRFMVVVSVYTKSILKQTFKFRLAWSIKIRSFVASHQFQYFFHCITSVSYAITLFLLIRGLQLLVHTIALLRSDVGRLRTQLTIQLAIHRSLIINLIVLYGWQMKIVGYSVMHT